MANFDRSKFDPEALQVLEHAHEEGQALRFNFFGAENWLLGLVREKTGAAARYILGTEVEIEHVRDVIIEILGHPSIGGGYYREHDPTPLAQKVYEDALKAGEGRITVEALARAITEDPKGVAGHAINIIREEVEQNLNLEQP